MLHFSPSPEVMHFFSEEVAKLAAFQDELQKGAGIAEMTVGEAAKHVAGKVGKHVPAMVAGAGLLYGAKRLHDDVRVGEAMRAQGQF